MRKMAAATVIAVLIAATPSNAQYSGGSTVVESAREIYQSCSRISAGSGMADIRAACACITGYMGGALNDRDYEVAAILLRIGEMSEAGAPDSAIEQEVIGLLQRGYSQADVQRVAALVEQIGARGDAVCGQFQGRASV